MDLGLDVKRSILNDAIANFNRSYHAVGDEVALNALNYALKLKSKDLFLSIEQSPIRNADGFYSYIFRLVFTDKTGHECSVWFNTEKEWYSNSCYGFKYIYEGFTRDIFKKKKQ